MSAPTISSIATSPTGSTGSTGSELPVDWFDDPDSRVDVATTTASGMGTQAVRFGLVGGLTTLLHLGGFAAVSVTMPTLNPVWANTVALSVATVVNTGLNRRWTFGVRHRRGAVTNQLQGFAVFALTWALTDLALLALGWAWPAAPTPAQTLVVAVATVASTAVKFVLMRQWMFADGHRPVRPYPPEPPRTPQPGSWNRPHIG